MDSNSKDIAKLVRSGDYFKESRDWYETLYISPISERTFFLLIAILAGLVGFIGFLAVVMFLPVTDRVPVLVPTVRMDEAVPSLVPLRTSHGTPIPQALKEFYIYEYVTKREGYAADQFAANVNFIRAQSDAPTFSAYVAAYDPANKQSPAAILTSVGKRNVVVNEIHIDDSHDPQTATVKFSTDVTGYTQTYHADWTAVLKFYYNDLVVTESKDPKTGNIDVKTKDPKFQVIGYALTQNK